MKKMKIKSVKTISMKYDFEAKVEKHWHLVWFFIKRWDLQKNVVSWKRFKQLEWKIRVRKEWNKKFYSLKDLIDNINSKVLNKLKENLEKQYY